jgi:hypothetical protein
MAESTTPMGMPMRNWPIPRRNVSALPFGRNIRIGSPAAWLVGIAASVLEMSIPPEKVRSALHHPDASILYHHVRENLCLANLRHSQHSHGAGSRANLWQQIQQGIGAVVANGPVNKRFPISPERILKQGRQLSLFRHFGALNLSFESVNNLSDLHKIQKIIAKHRDNNSVHLYSPS